MLLAERNLKGWKAGEMRGEILSISQSKGAEGEKPRTMDCHPGINAKYGRQEFWNPVPLYILKDIIA